MYPIVEFKDGVAVVPFIWLSKHERECAYPRCTSDTKISKIVTERTPPERS